MKFSEFIDLIKEKAGDKWADVRLEVPDEFNGGWLTITPENVVVDDIGPNGIPFVKLDCWKSYPDEP